MCACMYLSCVCLLLERLSGASGGRSACGCVCVCVSVPFMYVFICVCMFIACVYVYLCIRGCGTHVCMHVELP